MRERCLILNGNDKKNIVPVEKIALVSLEQKEKTCNATFYIDNGISVTLDNLSEADIDLIIKIMQYKV